MSKKRKTAALAALIIGFGAALSWPALADPLEGGPQVAASLLRGPAALVHPVEAPREPPAAWHEVAAAFDLPTEARRAFPTSEVGREVSGPAVRIHQTRR